MNDTISRQSAIDGLRDYLVGKRCPDDGTLTCRLIENEVINKLPPTQPKRGKWIPVTEDTLPEENRVVVVCGDKGTWDFGTYRGHGGNIHFWHWKKNTYKRVYWWMYKEDALPEPYKGVTE